MVSRSFAVPRVGTTAGTVAAGDDPRITGATSSKLLAGARYVLGQKPIVPAGHCYFGAHVNLLSQGSTDTASQAYRETQLGRVHDIGHHFYEWSDTSWPGTKETADVTAGRLPLVSWKGTTLATINAGTADSLIAASAARCAAFGWPVLLRWAWEMNGNWFAWSGPSNGSDPSAYASAWQRVWRIFQQNGASNVSFVWSPNYNSAPGGTDTSDLNNWRAYYPGDQYIDWIGVSGFNWGDYLSSGPWATLRSIIGAFVTDWQAGFGSLSTSNPPLMLAEWGCNPTPGNKPAWLTDAAAYIRSQGLSAAVYFDTDTNVDSTVNWAADSSAVSLTSYTEVTGRPFFGGITVGGSGYRAKVLADTPVDYWRFDEPSGTFASIGSGAHAGTETGTGMDRLAPSKRPGLGQAIATNSAAYVDVGTLGTFGAALKSGFTIECLFKYGATDGTTPQMAICGFLNDGSTTGLIIAHNTSRTLTATAGLLGCWVRDEAGTVRGCDVAAATAGVYDGLWHHFAWVCTPANATDVVYLDGAAATINSSSNATWTASSTANLGYSMTLAARNVRGAFSYKAIGALDEVAFYTSQLSSARVAAHYAAITA